MMTHDEMVLEEGYGIAEERVRQAKEDGWQFLNLSDLALRELPESLGDLSALQELRLDNNQLTALPESFGHLSALQELYLDNNQLTALPESFGDLSALQELRLDNNQLTELPESFGHLSALQELHLDNNQLTELPESFGHLSALQELHLDNNQLTELPESFGHLSALQELYLDNNQLTALPESFGHLSALRWLDLRVNQLTVLPESFGHLPSLQELHLDNNQLTELPESFGHLSALQELYLDNNQLTALPESFGHLSALRWLDLRVNQLTVLPESFGHLPSLQTLDLDNNQLTELPESLGDLSALQELHLDNNELTALPESFGHLSALQELHLDNNELTALPESFGHLSALRWLELRNNQLTALPESFGHLSTLQTLDLRDNQLTALPESFGHLSTLQTLELRDNQLTALPESFGHLSALQELHLDNNELTALPESFGHLSALRWLELRNNQLTALPESFGHLSTLQTLDLRDNQLTALPESFGHLSTLQTLELRDNQLTALPESFGHLSTLRTLYLYDNPLAPELQAAYAEGLETLFRFLRERSVALFQCKLLFVGEGNVGKSSLLSALRGEAWVESRDSTHGLEVHPLELPHSRESSSLSFRAWDFGGQTVYRPTHQLFFSAPAVYLVVWKPREGPEQGLVEYWIRLIQRRTVDPAQPEERPRILVVATHGGPKERVAHVDEEALRKAFPDLVVSFHHVDSRAGVGLVELCQAISSVAADLPHVGRKVPASWKRVVEMLVERSESQPYLSYEGYEALCRDLGVEAGLAADYARMLNRLGYLIYYAEDEGLRDVVILKPDWLSKAISYVLEDQQVKDANGLVRHERLARLWNDPERSEQYPAKLHPIFLRLMERFDLSYRVQLPAQAETSLIGQLVPGGRPNIATEWPAEPGPGMSECTQICRVVDVSTGDPAPAEGLIYWLIVRLHRYSLGRKDERMSRHWQTGLILEGGYLGRALLEQIGRDLRVTVRAVYPARFQSILCDEIRFLVDSFWKGLECRIAVPCPQRDCQGVFEIEELQALRAEEIFKARCPACKQFSVIDTLLAAHTPASGTEQVLAAVREGQAETQRVIREGFRIAGDDFRKLSSQLNEYASRADEQFAALMRAVTDEGRDSPRIFSLVPLEPGFWDRPGWASQKVRLTLWCEHSRLPLPQLWGDPKRGAYELELTHAWLTRAAPYLKLVASTLGMFLPVAAAGIKAGLDDTAYKSIEENLDLGQKALTGLIGGVAAPGDILGKEGPRGPQGKGAELPSFYVSDPLRTEYGAPEIARDGALRELQVLLKGKDPSFGGMKRVQNRRREYVWIHPSFEREFDPGLPEFPAPR